MTAQYSGQIQQNNTHSFKDTQADTAFDSELSEFFDLPNQWPSLPQQAERSTTPTHDKCFQVSRPSVLETPLPLFQRQDSVESLFASNTAFDDTDLSRFTYSGGESRTDSLMRSSMSASSYRLQELATFSPSQTCHDNIHTPASSRSSVSSRRLADATGEQHLKITETETSTSPTQYRCDNISGYTKAAVSDTKRSKGGRKRNPEFVEPGSARSVYLDKNRKAAKRCRSRQKQHQEDLVEQSRDLERRNKILNVEVAILRDSKQGLLSMVAQHVDCPDSRMDVYLQREADRIAVEAENYSKLRAQLLGSTSPPPPDS